MPTLSPCFVITIYVPLDEQVVLSALTTDDSRLGHVKLQNVIECIHRYDKIGKLGPYENVYNLSFAQEFYTPGPESEPAEGEIGVESMKRMMILTTYAMDVSISYLEQFFLEVKEAIGWEYPVIECHGPSGTLVWTREPKLQSAR